MLRKRLVACLVIKDNWVVQSIQFQRYLPVGTPEIALEYLARWDVDEIVVLDISATKDAKAPDPAMLARITPGCFVPITYGGGLRSVGQIRELIQGGADKVCINTGALHDPQLITGGADIFGSQCIVVSIDVRKESSGEYQVYGTSGRWATGRDPVEWAREAAELGAGEIFLTLIDRDGSKQGYDIPLVKMVSGAVSIPVVACGGVGHPDHFLEGIEDGQAAAVAAANFFNYTEHSVILSKAYLENAGIGIRLDATPNYRNFTFDSLGRIERKPGLEFNQINHHRG